MKFAGKLFFFFFSHMTGTVIIFYAVLTEIVHNCRHSADFINLNKDCFFFLFFFFFLFICDSLFLQRCFEFQFMFTSTNVWQLRMVLYTIQCYI